MLWMVCGHRTHESATMTMHVNLSAEMEGFIKSKVTSGFYGNATEVIRSAIRRMQADEVRAEGWQAALFPASSGYWAITPSSVSN